MGGSGELLLSPECSNLLLNARREVESEINRLLSKLEVLDSIEMINAVLRDTQCVTTDTDEPLNVIVRDLKDSGLIQKPTDWIVLYKLLSEQKIRMTMQQFTELVGDENIKGKSLYAADFVTDKKYPEWNQPVDMRASRFKHYCTIAKTIYPRFQNLFQK